MEKSASNVKKHGFVFLNILFWGALLSLPISPLLQFNFLQITPKALTLFFWVFFSLVYLFVMAKGHRKVLVVIFVVALGALASFYGFDILFPRQTTVKHEGVKYDSDSSNIFYKNFKEFIDNQKSVGKEIKIHFRINPGKTGYYDNVFQTSGWTKGVRFEINPETLVPALVVGSSRSNKTEAFFLPVLKSGSWDTVDISINRAGRVIILLNGKKTIESRTTNLDYLVDDIIVGNGYDDFRVFHGKIEDFNIEYTLYRSNPLKILFFIAFLILYADFFVNKSLVVKHAVVLIVLSAVMVAAHSAGDHLIVKKLSSNFKVNKYDSHSSDPKISKPFEFIETRPAQNRDLNINFKMKIKEIGFFPNVFQTAPGSEGVRMEISPTDSMAYLSIGTGKDKFVGLEFGQKIEPGKNYDVSITVSKEGHVEAFVNDKKAIDELIPYVNYSIGRIAVGKGYDEQRVFDGELKDFDIKYNLYVTQRNNLPFFLSVIALAIFLVFASAQKLVFANNLIMHKYFK